MQSDPSKQTQVILLTICTAVFLIAQSCLGQGTFIYDQESANETTRGGQSGVIQANQPIGQSFTPALSAIQFVRLSLGDTAINGIGATVYVNLRTNSITGPILASTAPVSMPDAFDGHPNFFFETPVPLAPGTTYFIQPIVQFGDTWTITGYNYDYLGGTAYIKGAPNELSDLWFREGIIIPEPSVLTLLLLGVGLLLRAGNHRP